VTTATDDARDRLRSWVADLIGRQDFEMRAVPGGGRHEAWVVTSGEDRWFLRKDSHPAPDLEHYTLRREATIYGAAHRSGVPVPEVIGVHPDLEAVLLEHKPGSAGFAVLDDASKDSVISSFAEVLAALHRTEVVGLELDGCHSATTIADAVRTELDIWERRITASGGVDPFVWACLLWLRDNVPDTGDATAVLVQGDTGPGNFLHDGGKVTALLDFELAHFGDPMEDIAWVGTRNAQEPVPDFGLFLDRYEAAGGHPRDAARIRYHMAFAEFRICALGMGREGVRNDMAEHGNGLIYGTLHRRLTVESLAAAMGVALPEATQLPADDTEATFLYDAILAQMAASVVPGLTEPLAIRRAKSLVRVVKHLRQRDRIGGEVLRNAELDDLAALLGRRPASIADGRRELQDLVRARTLGATEILPWAAAQVARDQQVSADAMGAFTRRHLPTI
jgi:aminoglycoside phosphotransferase (APT) family kinase protein